MANLQRYTRIICIVDGVILSQESSVETSVTRTGNAGIKITSMIPEAGMELDPMVGDKVTIHLVLAGQVKKYQTVVEGSFISHSVFEPAKQVLEFGILKEQKLSPEVLVIAKALEMAKR